MYKFHLIIAIIVFSGILVGCDFGKVLEKNCLYESTTNNGSRHNRRGYCDVDATGQILRYSNFKGAERVDFIVNKQEKIMKYSNLVMGDPYPAEIEIANSSDPEQWVVSKKDKMGNVFMVDIFTFGSEEEPKTKKRFKAAVKRNQKGSRVVELISISTERENCSYEHTDKDRSTIRVRERGVCFFDKITNNVYFNRVEDGDTLLLVSRLDTNSNVLQKFQSIEQKQQQILGSIESTSKKWVLTELTDNDSVHAFTFD